MKFFHFKISEIAMMLAGVGFVAGLPFLAGGGVILWKAAMGIYFVGLLFMLLDK